MTGEEAEAVKLDDVLQKYFELREVIKEKESEKIWITEKTQETEVQIQNFEKELCEIKNSCKENEECLKNLKERADKNEAEYLFVKKSVANFIDYNSQLSFQQTEHQQIIETLTMMIRDKKNAYELLSEELKVKEKRINDLVLQKLSLSGKQTLSLYNAKLKSMENEKNGTEAELMKNNKELEVLSEQMSNDKERYEREHIEVCESIKKLAKKTRKLRLRQNFVGSIA